MIRNPIAAVMLACLLAAGCRTQAGASEESTAAGNSRSAPATHRDDEAAVLVVDPGMLKAITVDDVRDRAWTHTLTLTGKVQFDEDRLARILAPLAGQVTDLHVRVGDALHKNQPLLSINSRDAAAAVGEHAESHKDLELAQKTADMTADLFEHEAASKMALQQAQNDLAKARARVDRSEQALHALGLPTEDQIAAFNGRVPVVSPIAGTVIERHVTDGQFVQPDSNPILVVADLSSVWVMGEIFERDLHLAAVGDKATITTAAYPGERFIGRIDYISDVIDPATRTASVRVAVPNRAGRLKPEMFATISLAVSASGRVLTVPDRAAFVDGGRTWVYVATAPGRFARRAVDVADAEAGDRRVLGGLSAGERVVVDGALLLRQQEEKRVD